MSELLELKHKSPDFIFYEAILKSFELWSPQFQPSKFQLSSAGFYYTGRNDNDGVFFLRY